MNADAIRDDNHPVAAAFRCAAEGQGVKSITIELPLPHRSLSPNARSHWRALAKHKAAYRLRSKIGTNAVLLCRNPRWEKATTTIVWYTKTVRHPDPDNALASLKAAFDGFKDAGLLHDDSGLGHNPIRFLKDANNPRVEITVTT